MQIIFTNDYFGIYVILAGIVFALAICLAPLLRYLFDKSHRRKSAKPDKSKDRSKTFQKK